jgi:hypothetical protein
MKLLAAAYGFANHDSRYGNQERKRWWSGYYKRSRAAAFLVAQIIATVAVSLSIGGLVGLGLLILNTGFIVVTIWCLL